MHFIFSPIGSAGDVYPMLGIAVELHRRGHEVTFLANGYFQKTVEGCGLRFVELGTREYFHSVVNHPDLWTPRRAFRYVFHRAVQPIIRGQYAAIEELTKSKETVVVANCLGFGARLAQEQLGVPLVTIHIQPAVILSRIEPPTFPGVVGPRWLKGLLFSLAERFVINRTVCPEVNRFRHELGHLASCPMVALAAACRLPLPGMVRTATDRLAEEPGASGFLALGRANRRRADTGSSGVP